MLLGKYPIEPLRLSLSRRLIYECGIMKDDELLTTTVTPECAHFLESWCLLSRLTLLDRHCPHSLTFYPAAAVCSQFALPPLTASEGIISLDAVVESRPTEVQGWNRFPTGDETRSREEEQGSQA